MGTPDSQTFNVTERPLIVLLTRMFEKNSLGPANIRCEVTAFRPMNDGDRTRVDTICTYRSNSTSSPFERVRVYQEVSNSTKGITILGPYSLDKNSLYVNGRCRAFS
uniref:SEA domain-containing protein n=1 Tax=Sphenodon punctatus TaxID=8508 RepID=A0A8D0H4R2_SPHPU